MGWRPSEGQPFAIRMIVYKGKEAGMGVKKKRRTIDPRKARAASGGGIYPLPYPSPSKTCAKCQQPRYSVDGTGACGYCRAVARVQREQASDGPDPF